MPPYRVTITDPSQERPDQFFSPTLENAKVELKKWAEKGHHGKYKITETVEKVVEEGEC